MLYHFAGCGAHKFRPAPSDRDGGTYFFGFAALENPRSQPRLAENTSQPGCPYAILTAHVSILSERKALTAFSA